LVRVARQQNTSEKETSNIVCTSSPPYIPGHVPVCSIRWRLTRLLLVPNKRTNDA